MHILLFYFKNSKNKDINQRNLRYQRENNIILSQQQGY